MWTINGLGTAFTNTLRPKFVSLVLCISLVPPVAAATIQCPALDSKGNSFPMQPDPQPLPLDIKISIPESESAAVKAALDVVGKFEAGGLDPWTNVSGQEELSVGFMQWNWRSGSLISAFMHEVPKSAISLAPDPISAGVLALKHYADYPKSVEAKSRARDAIADWTKSRSDDPLVAGRLRKTVVKAWRDWLGTEDIRKVQQALINVEVSKAYAHAVAWREATAGNAPSVPVDARLMSYFFDLVTFNGSTKGVWIDQVRAFRSNFQDNAAVVRHAADWLDACAKFTSTANVINRKMYARRDAIETAKIWRNAVNANPLIFNDEQINLLAHAILRARQSTGSDPPRGFPGIYQADVLTRRGSLVLGLGMVHGQLVSDFSSSYRPETLRTLKP